MLEINTMKQRILYILVCVSVWMMSCDKEDALSPTKTPEIGVRSPAKVIMTTIRRSWIGVNDTILSFFTSLI